MSMETFRRATRVRIAFLAGLALLTSVALSPPANADETVPAAYKGDGGSEMYNSLAPAMFATGKFRALAQIRELIVQLGLPDAPFLLYMCDQSYAAAHPANVRAYLAAYREALEILKVDDAVWLERGKQMKLDEQGIVPFRDAARKDLIGKFSPTTEADIRKTFDLLLATAGSGVLGLSEMPAGFMTLEYQ